MAVSRLSAFRRPAKNKDIKCGCQRTPLRPLVPLFGSLAIFTMGIASADDTTYQARVILARKLFGLLTLCCCALTLAVPSLARGAHSLEHVQSPVAHGEVHSHDHDAATETDSSQQAPVKSPEAPEGKPGHSHMGSSAFDLTYPPGQQMRPSEIVRSDTGSPANTPALATLGWTPPVRPPRTA